MRRILSNLTLLAAFSKIWPPSYAPGKENRVWETPGYGSMLEKQAVPQMRAASLTLLVHNQICRPTPQIRPLATPLEMTSLPTFTCGLSLLLSQHEQPGQSCGAARCGSVPRGKPSSAPAPGRSSFLLEGPSSSAVCPELSAAWEPREEAASPCAVPLIGRWCWRDDAHILFLAQPAAGS